MSRIAIDILWRTWVQHDPTVDVWTGDNQYTRTFSQLEQERGPLRIFHTYDHDTEGVYRLADQAPVTVTPKGNGFYRVHTPSGNLLGHSDAELLERRGLPVPPAPDYPPKPDIPPEPESGAVLMNGKDVLTLNDDGKWEEFASWAELVDFARKHGYPVHPIGDEILGGDDE